MAVSQAATPARASTDKTVGRLFLLNLAAGQVLSVNPDGSDKKVLASGYPLPDGIVVDVEAGHIYWTNMGVPNKNDGYIERADLDGGNRKTIVPRASPSLPSSSTSRRRAESCTGRIGRGCG